MMCGAMVRCGVEVERVTCGVDEGGDCGCGDGCDCCGVGDVGCV